MIYEKILSYEIEVELSERADHDLKNIFLYIVIDLSSPENAAKWLRRLWKEIKSLNELPGYYRYQYAKPFQDETRGKLSHL